MTIPQQPAGSGRRLFLLNLAVLGLLACSEPSSKSRQASPWINISIENPGVYALAWDEIAAEIKDLKPLASERLHLSNQGKPVPIWIEDGQDGIFGPGDHLEFVAQHLAGEGSYYNEYSVWNVYRLRADEDGGARMTAPLLDQRAKLPEDGPEQNPLRVWEHIERDRMLLRFAAGPKGEIPEAWYWARISHLGKRPFQVRFNLADRDPEAPGPTSLRIALHGWSSQAEAQRSELTDHRLEVYLNETLVGSSEWNGQSKQQIDIASLPANILQPKRNTLRLSVPSRRPKGRRDPLVDVVLLNWIEIGYPRRPHLGREPAMIYLAEMAGNTIELRSQRDEFIVYSQGSRFSSRDMEHTREGTEHRYRFVLPNKVAASDGLPGPSSPPLHVLPGKNLATPAAITRSAPPSLTKTGYQSDYLILTHPSLRAAIMPLADYHRQQGLQVDVIDIGQVYDDFNHGIQHPRAIRDFLAHAHANWRRPAPRFVLLVGDASWDLRNEKIRDSNYVDWAFNPGQGNIWSKNASTTYTGALGSARNLIPTWRLHTHEGHAASDNWFVTLDADYFPDLAIGRLPVVTPEAVEAIVAKTLAYATEPEVGPWRRRLLLITNEEILYQKYSDTIAKKAGHQGFDSTTVYPSVREEHNAEHNEFLKKSFDAGNLLVHFIGHGGRYIWRTGPPDLSKNHDLFTLEDLDLLQPNRRLPVVLSLTCYSAPFDHPSADSIGEKFLRLADRGAVAVLAASWRNNPNPIFSDLLVRELTRGGAIGESILRAKKQIKNRDLAQTYNLLGDPALKLALPGLELILSTGPDSTSVDASSPDATAQDTATGFPILVQIPTPEFHGRAIVDWLDAQGETLESEELAISGPEFKLTRPELPAAAIHTLRVYVWNKEQGIDAFGGLRLQQPRRHSRGKNPGRASKPSNLANSETS